MLKKITITGLGVMAGLLFGLVISTQTTLLSTLDLNRSPQIDTDNKPKKVIGFLPFWLIDKAQPDYKGYITQLSYFNVVLDSDGTIQKFTAPGESDPGWHSLSTGKVDSYLAAQKALGIELSITVFSGNDNKINSFLENPESSAENLLRDLAPILVKYGFSDVNLDIEKVSDATTDQRARFTQFVKTFREKLDPQYTLTIDTTAISFVKETNLSDPASLAKYADYIVLMGYDFHNPSSLVTGPVAPQWGAGIVNEFDIESSIQAAKTIVPGKKLILAIPLYGYSWETINPIPRSAVMPGSAYSISSRNIAELLSGCTNCSVEFDARDGESRIVYLNEETGLYHQIFYPNKNSTQIKIDFANTQNIAGIALWALGYEDNEILTPLYNYNSN